MSARAPRTVSYASVMTPAGRIWMARGATGVVRVSLRSRSEREFVSALRGSRALRRAEVRRDPAALRDLGLQITQYFRRIRREFTLEVDLSALTPFQRRVLEATARVPFGQVASYGAIAAEIGRPGASRAVGNALSANPVPILIPCHRIVASGGAIGGFTGGLALKRRLLAVEGIAL